MTQENGTQVRKGSESLKDLDEYGDLVTSEKAAQMLGIQKPSFFAIAYSGKVEAFRMGGAILVKRNSVVAYKKVMDARAVEQKTKADAKAKEDAAKARQKALTERLASLTPDQLEALLAKV